jgi:hypothetical protein
MLRDDLRLLIIELGQLTSGSSLDSQQFVVLRVNGLRVPMLRPLDKQRHQNVATVATDCQSKLFGLRTNQAPT